MKTKEKVESKKGKKLKIVLLVIAAIVIVAVAFINLTTLPKYDDDKNVIYVGSMVKSKTIDYKDKSGEGLTKNPIVKIMQMVWRFCDGGDKSKHAKQNPPQNIEIISDIAYIDDGNYYHKLDVMYPNNISENDKLPVIIDIHGGGWMYGIKGLMKIIAVRLPTGDMLFLILTTVLCLMLMLMSRLRTLCLRLNG